LQFVKQLSGSEKIAEGIFTEVNNSPFMKDDGAMFRRPSGNMTIERNLQYKRKNLGVWKAKREK
jgi:hypothetical protein